jgi:hypothetical protein
MHEIRTHCVRPKKDYLRLQQQQPKKPKYQTLSLLKPLLPPNFSSFPFSIIPHDAMDGATEGPLNMIPLSLVYVVGCFPFCSFFFSSGPYGSHVHYMNPTLLYSCQIPHKQVSLSFNIFSLNNITWLATPLFRCACSNSKVHWQFSVRLAQNLR